MSVSDAVRQIVERNREARRKSTHFMARLRGAFAAEDWSEYDRLMAEKEQEYHDQLSPDEPEPGSPGSPGEPADAR